MRGLNRDQIVKIARSIGCKNFVGKRKKFIFNAFVRHKYKKYTNKIYIAPGILKRIRAQTHGVTRR